jgi:purine nucleosidase/pyrimidine-specific ribonucleoside hydrolase
VRKRIIIDCDPGIDDAIAILAALGSNAFDVHAITSVPGNVPSSVGAANAQKIVRLAGRPETTVAKGADHPLNGSLSPDPFSHGSDGLADTNLPAPETPLDPRDAATLIVEAADASAGQLTLVEIGPMTNLALALELDPHLPQKLESVVAIAGMFGLNEYGWRHATGDNPTSEWNVFVDPEAARRVIHAGFNLTLLGLDVATHPNNTVSDRVLNRLAQSKGPAAQFLCDAIEFVTSRGFNRYCSLIDPLAVTFAARPALFKTEVLAIDVETEGRLTRGQTVVERRSHFRWPELAPVSVVVDVDYTAAVEFICDAVLACDGEAVSLTQQPVLRGPGGELDRRG